MLLRQEVVDDYQMSEQVVVKEFRKAELADHTEHLLVQKLRQSKNFISELLLDAEKYGVIAWSYPYTDVRSKLIIEL